MAAHRSILAPSHVERHRPWTGPQNVMPPLSPASAPASSASSIKSHALRRVGALMNVHTSPSSAGVRQLAMNAALRSRAALRVP